MTIAYTDPPPVRRLRECENRMCDKLTENERFCSTACSNTRHATWTPKMVRRLKDLHGAGMSASKSAVAINAEFGTAFTKNAVIGKWRRLGFSDNGNSTGTCRPRGVETPPASKCQFPHGNPGEKGFRFCGAPVAQSSPYCAEHHRVCYVPNSARVSLRALSVGF